MPLEIRVDSKELPANSNRGLECYFIQAPRVSYLPLLIPEIKRFLQDVVFDDEAARTMKEEDWWFESEDGHLLKWCVSPPQVFRSYHPFSTGDAQALAYWAYLRQSHNSSNFPSRGIRICSLAGNSFAPHAPSGLAAHR